MSTRTTYTSTIRVPVYASWKCENCDEVNFSTGVITYKAQQSTTSIRNSKHEEAKSRASDLAQSQWAEHAFRIISKPTTYAIELHDNLSLMNSCCTNCNKKPRWDKAKNLSLWSVLCFMPAIISGIVAFSSGGNLTAWLIFIALAGIFLSAPIYNSVYKRKMKNLPKAYIPVLGSINPELIAYANHLRQTIPTPEETIAIVKGCFSDESPIDEDSCTVDDDILKERSRSNSSKQIQCNFCRKCGAQLHSDSEYCHKCGTQNIH